MFVYSLFGGILVAHCKDDKIIWFSWFHFAYPRLCSISPPSSYLHVADGCPTKVKLRDENSSKKREESRTKHQGAAAGVAAKVVDNNPTGGGT